MRAALTTLFEIIGRLATIKVTSRLDKALLCILALLHGAALWLMAATEVDLVARLAFLLVWALLNFFWLALLRRPIIAAVLSLELFVALILLSQFKHGKLWMTADFVDVMIIDRDTAAFLFAAFPSLRLPVAIIAIATAVFVSLAWRLDPIRIRARVSSFSGVLCFSTFIALALARAGATDEALGFLASALDRGFAVHLLVSSNPWAAPIRADPRWEELARRSEAFTREAAAMYLAAGGERLLGVRAR